MKLYEINQAIANCIIDGDTVVNGATGEVLDVKSLDELKMAREEKIKNVALYIKNLRSDQDELKVAIKGLQERLKASEKKEAGLTEYLKSCMEQGETVHDSLYDIKWRKSKRLQIDEHASLPVMYLRTKVEPDKVAITAALKDGKEVPGCQLIENINMKVV